VFEVKVDGRLVFSRLQTDRFPTVDEIAPALVPAKA
jgi:selT/selW/selH-like putative selenoprotein